MHKKNYVILMMLTILLIMAGCKSPFEEPVSYEEENHVVLDDENNKDNKENSEEAMEEENYIDEVIQEYLTNMTLKEKVGQVFMEALRYNENNRPMKYLSEKGSKTIKDYHLGGIILFSENISTIEQTMELINDMQNSSNIPLFIAIDEEGGRVSRLNSSPNMPATKLPGNKVLGSTADLELAYGVGEILGRELLALGINMNLAPVADVNTNPKNPVIGDRAFGDDPYETGKMVSAMTRGIQDQNISAVLKHFPGHGDTSLDTHKEAVVIQHNIDRLKSVELIPFQKGIDANVDGIMLAHIQTPNITGNNYPATFSKDIVEGILRNDLNYNNLIITDALEMMAISKYWSPEEAAVLAFKAGVDILLMPESISEAYDGLLQAVVSGEITEERLNESVERILMIKYKRGVLDGNNQILDAYEVVGSKEHQDVVEKIIEAKRN